MILNLKMFALSVKELRQKLPFVRSELKKGSSFLIIFQSQPIATLSPVEMGKDLDFSEADEREEAAIADLNEEDLSKEELAYYMQLSDKK